MLNPQLADQLLLGLYINARRLVRELDYKRRQACQGAISVGQREACRLGASQAAQVRAIRAGMKGQPYPEQIPK